MTFPVTEAAGQLRASGTVILDESGNGVISLSPDNARQRWEVTSVVVSTNQAAAATVVPVATVALNTSDIATLSDGNNRGQSWSGNQDTFAGKTDIGPCDNLSVGFSAPPGTASTTTTGTGTATTPGAFQQLASITLPGPGTWTVTWSLTLSGTPGSADTNNVRLVKNGTVFLVESVNAGAGGTYPQAGYSYTGVTGDVIDLTVGPANANTGAVYTVSLSVTGSPLAGVIAKAVVTGTKYTRRA